jgi:hypothetical protein
VSVWETLEDAHQMDTLAAMLAQRPILEQAGVTFEPISDQETSWAIATERRGSGNAAKWASW